MLKTLTPEEKKQEPVAHALKIRNALVQCNYGRFFKLYQSAPGKASALIDVFIDKIRIQCLQKLVVGFIATNIQLNYLSGLLAFTSPDELDSFLVERGKQQKFLPHHPIHLHSLTHNQLIYSCSS